MFNFLPRPTHTLHVMKPFESSLQFIMVCNYNTQRKVAALQWRKDCEDEAYA